VIYTFMNGSPTLFAKRSIKEAILDIRAKLPVSVDADRLLSLHTRIAGQYPSKQVRRKWEGEIRVGDNAQPEARSTVSEIDRYLFRSSDDTRIVQYRLDGFTFNRLRPYDNWASFRDEAKRLWNIYIEAVMPEQITRIALRYINQMLIPAPIVNFDDYLTAGPVVPEKLPQQVSSFVTRVVIHEPQIKASAVITQAFEKIIEPDIVPIILDIDVIKVAQLGVNYEQMWETFEALRNFKNSIFFESITEKTTELFQ
jgi:uncharacterized protein (TIGR04255 family)